MVGFFPRYWDIVVQSLSMFDYLQFHGLQHSRLPCLSLSPRVCWLSCHPTIPSSVTPFSSCSQSFPASGSFTVSWLFASDGQNIVASVSVSVLLMNIQGWFSLELTGLLSLLSKGLSRVFSTTVGKHRYSVLSLLYGPALTSVPDYWENNSLDDMDIC